MSYLKVSLWLNLNMLSRLDLTLTLEPEDFLCGVRSYLCRMSCESLSTKHSLLASVLLSSGLYNRKPPTFLQLVLLLSDVLWPSTPGIVWALGYCSLAVQSTMKLCHS